MFCGKCGQQIPDDSKFCYKCGNEIPACKDINSNTPENSNRQKVDNGKTSSVKVLYRLKGKNHIEIIGIVYS